jgi:hypothetical protein
MAYYRKKVLTMQNDMRDRLVKVIMNCETYRQPCTNCKKDVSCSRCTSEYLADHLIANGVIVPPCKVGDTVYGFNYTLEGTHIIEETVESIQWEMQTEYIWYDYIELGKTVFLTKEQAEQKLNEMRADNE